MRNAAALDPRRRRRGEARRRPQAARRGAGDPRRRDPGDGPHRPHAAVDPRARRLQGAGQAARRGPRDRRRRGRARRGRLLRDRARVRARRRRPHGHRLGRRARRSASAPAGTATARCSCSTTCSGFAGPARARSSSAATRRSRPTRSPRSSRVRRRRARRAVPVERRDVPHGRQMRRRRSASTAGIDARPRDRTPLSRSHDRRRGDRSPRGRGRRRARRRGRWCGAGVHPRDGVDAWAERDAVDAGRGRLALRRRPSRRGAVRGPHRGAARGRRTLPARRRSPTTTTERGRRGCRDAARPRAVRRDAVRVRRAESDAAFTMATVPMPLEIGFYDADGTPASTALQMEPCPRHRGDVPRRTPRRAVPVRARTPAGVGVPTGATFRAELTHPACRRLDRSRAKSRST